MKRFQVILKYIEFLGAGILRTMELFYNFFLIFLLLEKFIFYKTYSEFPSPNFSQNFPAFPIIQINTLLFSCQKTVSYLKINNKDKTKTNKPEQNKASHQKEKSQGKKKNKKHIQTQKQTCLLIQKSHNNTKPESMIYKQRTCKKKKLS